MLLLGTKNTTSQTLTVNGTVNLGEVYRRYCKKNSCGVKAFDFNGTSVALQQSGIYHITTMLTYTAPAAGVITFQLYENGNAITGAIASETITTATTETRSSVIDIYVLVDNTYILDTISTAVKNISIVNTGDESTVTNVIFNVEKVV